MKNYLIYNSKGEILVTGVVNDRTWPYLAGRAEREGVLLMEGIASDYWNRVVDEKIVMQPSGEIELKNPPRAFVPLVDRARLAQKHISKDEWEKLMGRIEKIEGQIENA